MCLSLEKGGVPKQNPYNNPIFASAWALHLEDPLLGYALRLRECGLCIRSMVLTFSKE
jgi:hypothetical protein